ncbi:MAG: ATP-binding protein [Trichlorobacter sp.]
MFRPGIFVKIYLCFWLTIVLVLTTRLALDHLNASGPFSMVGIFRKTSLEMYGQAALAHLQAGRQKEAVQLAERFKATTRIDAYLLDNAGNRLDGGPVGKAEQALVSSKTKHLSWNNKYLTALTIIGPDSKPYIVVGSLDYLHLLPLPLLGNPNMAFQLSIVLIISGFVCFLLTRYLVSPLIVLRDATGRFASGELSVRIGKRIGRRKDEITELARDFDVMADQIESLMKLQQQLIGIISHELRSPLARLNVALDLARRKIGAEAEHALNRIEEEAQELNEMINDLLTLTRLENGHVFFEMGPVDIVELVREIAEDGDFEAQGSNRGVKIIMFDKCFIFGNIELLKSAMENVVRNAIRYTQENTDVEISIRRQNRDKIQIAVRDHGPGLPDKELNNIFRPFYRVSDSRERQTGGTGLGLSISERAVHLHHGTISAENAADGGLIVCIALPTTSKE